jgi:hypothetical protein
LPRLAKLGMANLEPRPGPLASPLRAAPGMTWGKWPYAPDAYFGWRSRMVQEATIEPVGPVAFWVKQASIRSCEMIVMR